LRFYFVENIPALATQKSVNKAIHPQSPIQYWICKGSQNFFTNGFSNDFSSQVWVKMCAWNILLTEEFMILIPSISFSFCRNPHCLCIF